MQKMRIRIFGLIFALATMAGLLVALPTAAFALDHPVSNDAEFVTAITSFADGDSITLSADIEYPDDITLTDRLLTIDLNGHELTLVDAGTYKELRTVSGNITITGNGLITASGIRVDAGVLSIEADIDAKTFEGIWACLGATVTVVGAIDSAYYGIRAEDPGTEVSVTGDITADEVGVHAADGAQVDITGTVTGVQCGINARDNNTIVTIKGDVISDDGDGVDAVEQASVSVIGNITAGENGVFANRAGKVDIKGNIDAGSDGISASNSGTSVTIVGDVDASQGVSAEYEALVSLVGNITCIRRGITASTGAEVSMTGDITLPDTGIVVPMTHGGITVIEDANVALLGNIVVEGYMMYGVDTMLGGTASIKGNVSVTGTGPTAVLAGADSTVSITGDVFADGGTIPNPVTIGIDAEDGATVDITGSVTVLSAAAIGVRVLNGVEVTIDGVLTAQNYVTAWVYVSSWNVHVKAPEDNDAASSKPGFLQYTFEGFLDDQGAPFLASVVWIRGVPAIPGAIVPATGDRAALQFGGVLLFAVSAGAAFLLAYRRRKTIQE